MKNLNKKIDNFLEKVGLFNILLILILLTIFKITFAIVISDSGSMEPTIKKGERNLLLKRYFEIKRGDIVSFEKYKDFEHNSSMNIGKRIVAIPGDKIYIKENRLYVRPKDGDDYIKKNFVNKFFFNNEMFIKEPYPHIYKEDLGINDKNITSPNEFLEKVLPDDCYYVMGDNRNNSADSRIYGCVSKDSINGKYLIF